MAAFDITTFVNLVREMRDTQKRYFRTKDYNAMLDSKRIEGMVDREIQKFDDEQKLGKDLFEEKGQDDLPF